MQSVTQTGVHQAHTPPSADGHRETFEGVRLRTALKIIALVAGSVVGLFLLWRCRQVFMLAFAGLLFAIFLQSLADAFGRYTRLPHLWSLAVVVLLLVAVLAVLAWMIGAQLLAQFGQLSQALPDALDQLREQVNGSSWGRWIAGRLPEPEQMLTQRGFLSQVTGITSGVINATVGIVVIVFVGLYGAAQPDWYRRGIMYLIPQRNRERAAEVMDETAKMLRWWVVGQVFAMTVVGLVTSIGLWMLSAPLPLAMGLLAFVLEIVPNIGPVLSAVPALLLASTQGPTHTWHVLLLYIGIQGVESYVLMPLIQARVVELPPAVQILAVLLFGMLFGILGVLLAAPLVITTIILVRLLYVRDVLDDPAGEIQPASA
jgi:predicted PurR-regulated permease PerM